VEISNNINNRINKYNKPAFKADIHVLTNNEFLNRKWLPNIQRHSSDYCDIYHSIIKESRPIYSETAYDCSICAFTNKEAQIANLSHICPDEDNMKNLDNIQQKLYDWGKELYQKSKTKLEGFVTGGKDSTTWNEQELCNIYGDSRGQYIHKRYSNSPILQNKIIEVYETLSKNLGLDYSVLGLQKTLPTGVEVITDPRINTHFINISSDFGSQTKLEDVAKIFKNKRLSDTDRVLFDYVDKTKEFRNIIAQENKLRKE